MKLSIYFFIAFCLLPLVLLADEQPGKTEITIYSGVSFLKAENTITPVPCPICAGIPLPVPDLFFPLQQNISFDGGILIGFKGGYYLNRNMEIEGNFSIAPNQHVTTESIFVCPPGIVCPLKESPSSPIAIPFFLTKTRAVSYYYDGNFVYNFSGENATPYVTFGIGGVSTSLDQQTNTDLAINFGGGVKFRFHTFGFRVEANDHVIRDDFFSGKTEHDFQVQYGVLFHL